MRHFHFRCNTKQLSSFFQIVPWASILNNSIKTFCLKLVSVIVCPKKIGFQVKATFICGIILTNNESLNFFSKNWQQRTLRIPSANWMEIHFADRHRFTKMVKENTFRCIWLWALKYKVDHDHAYLNLLLFCNLKF